MITDMINDHKLNSVVTELFFRGRKLNISLVFCAQSYFKVPKYVRLNLPAFSSWKFQIIKNFNRLHYIIHQTLTLKILLESTKIIPEPCSCFR